MSESMVISILKDAITTAIIIAGPLLIVAVVIGLIVSIFQATTQIQEQTLTFLPKVLCVALVGLLIGSFMLHTLEGFTERIFSIISNITK